MGLANISKLLLLNFVFGFSLAAKTPPQAPFCEDMLMPYKLEKEFPTRNIKDIKTLKVGSYNLYNLYEYQGKLVYDYEGHRGRMVEEPRPKEAFKIKELAQTILSEDPDILVCQEVEKIQALELFNRLHLKGAYRVLLIEGNDPRGIDIAFLVKKDLPFDLKLLSHKNRLAKDPLFPKRAATRIFSRDLPVLEIREKGKTSESLPLLSVFGTHYKSKRPRPGDPLGEMLRKVQVEETLKLIEIYKEIYGPKFVYILAGDFNGQARSEAAFEAIQKNKDMGDPFDFIEPKASDLERVTHSYHPKASEEDPHPVTEYSQIDHILVSSWFLQDKTRMKKIYVYRYKNEDNSVRPLPKTWDEREKNPSDHFPIFFDFDFAQLFNR